MIMGEIYKHIKKDDMDRTGREDINISGEVLHSRNRSFLRTFYVNVKYTNQEFAMNTR